MAHGHTGWNTFFDSIKNNIKRYYQQLNTWCGKHKKLISMLYIGIFLLSGLALVRIVFWFFIGELGVFLMCTSYGECCPVGLYRLCENAPEITVWPSVLWYILFAGCTALLWHKNRDGNRKYHSSACVLRALFILFTTLLFTVIPVYIMWDFNYDTLNTLRYRWLVFAIVLVLAFIGNLFPAFLLRNTSSKNLSHFFPTVAVAVILVLASCIVKSDGKGCVGYVPVSAEEVESVYIKYARLKEKENIEAVLSLHRLFLSNQEKNMASDDCAELVFIYHLTDGTKIRRVYHIALGTEEAPDEQRIAAEAVINCKEAALFRSLPAGLPISEEYEITKCTVSWHSSDEQGFRSEAKLSKEQAEYFYENCLMPDVLDGKAGIKTLSGDGSVVYPYNNSMSSVFVHFRFSPMDFDGVWFDVAPAICMDADRCLTWLSENYGVSAQSWAECWKIE